MKEFKVKMSKTGIAAASWRNSETARQRDSDLSRCPRCHRLKRLESGWEELEKAGKGREQISYRAIELPS